MKRNSRNSRKERGIGEEKGNEKKSKKSGRNRGGGIATITREKRDWRIV